MASRYQSFSITAFNLLKSAASKPILSTVVPCSSLTFSRQVSSACLFGRSIFSPHHRLSSFRSLPPPHISTYPARVVSRSFAQGANVKFPKQRRGRLKGIAHQGNHISFGQFGLQVLEPSWITARQIEAGRRALTPHARRGGKIWIRVIADKSVTKRPAETRMGRGKGAIAYHVAAVQPGRILYEMGGVTEAVAREAISLAASKMPVQTRFVILK